MVPSTAIVMARDAPSQYVLLEGGDPPVLRNSGDAQALRLFVGLCAWGSHCHFNFFKEILLTGA